jgi:hypothetical protein
MGAILPIPKRGFVPIESMPLKERDDDNRTNTRNAKNIAGSVRTAKVSSRLEPIPSKAEPVSRAAAVVKNRERPKRYAKRIKSPVNEITEGIRPKGMNRPATRGTAILRMGPP